jgi:GntR family transcriptional regulator
MRPGTPRYRQLAEIIRSRILDGTYPAEGRLPTETDFMEEFGYSRDTVRAAMKVLSATGWVVVTHGLGMFAGRPEDRTDG